MNRELTRALKKLERSSTALTRKRARRAFRALADRVLKSFPLLDAEGQEKKEKYCACLCPICKVPMRSWESLVKHLRATHWKNLKLRIIDTMRDEHGRHDFTRCEVCKNKVATKIYNRHLGKHLAHYSPENLTNYVIAEASKSEFGEHTKGEKK